MKLNWTQACLLEGLEESEVPIETRTKSFSIKVAGSTSEECNKISVQRRQLPITPAYAFTDYRSQGQMLGTVIADISSPPSGQITVRNTYVALSRSHGQETIWLLQPFDEKFWGHSKKNWGKLEELNEATQRRDAEKGIWVQLPCPLDISSILAHVHLTVG